MNEPIVIVGDLHG
jgi:serine/threonine-protein phosphatase 2B catalytic subunit